MRGCRISRECHLGGGGDSGMVSKMICQVVNFNKVSVTLQLVSLIILAIC